MRYLSLCWHRGDINAEFSLFLPSYPGCLPTRLTEVPRPPPVSKFSRCKQGQESERTVFFFFKFETGQLAEVTGAKLRMNEALISPFLVLSCALPQSLWSLSFSRSSMHSWTHSSMELAQMKMPLLVMKLKKKGEEDYKLRYLGGEPGPPPSSIPSLN